MAHSLISKRLLEIISNRHAENAKRPGSRHFQISKAICMDIRPSATVGHRDRLVGALSQAQMRRLP
jgi:hypothetical protein